MKTLTQGLAMLIVVSSTSVVCSEQNKSSSLNRLIEISGIPKDISAIPEMVRLGLEGARQRGVPIPQTEFDEVMTSIYGAFQPSEMLDIIRLDANKSVSESEAATLLGWYESELGRKITKAEQEASTPEAYQEMLKEMKSLFADEKRVEVAKKLNSLLNGTDIAMQIQEDVGLAVFMAMSKIKHPGQPVHIEAFMSQMLAQEQQIRTDVEQQTVAFYVYTYKGIHMDSLEKYIEFSQGPTSRNFNNIVINGMKRAINSSLEKMAGLLAVTFR